MDDRSRDPSRHVVRTRAGSLLVGEMQRGCKLCIRGAKLALFITGLCSKGCFYCPLSEKRRWRDSVYANERLVRSKGDVIEEAELIDAMGTGITGGDPTLRFERVLGYILLLKRRFGRRHHVHMYCVGELSPEQLRKLKKVGLDELRFHTWSPKPLLGALEQGLNAGVEIPVIPGKLGRMVELLRELDRIGCAFVNLNELEISHTNLAAMRARGYRVKSGESMAVKGSEELAIEVLRWAADNTGLNVHYCPSSLKDRFQLRNRLKRRAKNVAGPHELITGDGLLVKGVAYGIPLNRLIPMRRRLVERYGIPRKLLVIDREKLRLEMPPGVAEKLSRLEPGLKFAWVEEYPTVDRLETTLIPLPI